MTDNSRDPAGPKKARPIQVIVRKKRSLVDRSLPRPVPAKLGTAPAADIVASSRPDRENLAAVPDAGANANSGDNSEASQAADAVETPPFRSLEGVPYEAVPWQGAGLLKKTGVALLVAPPGAGCFALCAYLAAYLSGRTFTPFGAARYPGDVLFTTHTPHLDRSMRAAISSQYPGAKSILTRQTSKRFNWKLAASTLKEALAGRPEGATSAVIIDTGPVPDRLTEHVVDTAYGELNKAAEKAGCLVVLVVEFSSSNPDPFERIPRSLRLIRGTLLTVPMRSKALAPEPGDAAEFLLLRLPEAAPYALAARFALMPVLDNTESARIDWGCPGFVNPRDAFRRSDIMDLTVAQRTAVQLAADIIRHRGPTSSRDLQAAGNHVRGIAPTTMRDALSIAKLLGHLDCARNMLDGKSFWIIPGVTQLPSGMYLPHALRDDQLPF